MCKKFIFVIFIIDVNVWWFVFVCMSRRVKVYLGSVGMFDVDDIEIGFV